MNKKRKSKKFAVRPKSTKKRTKKRTIKKITRGGSKINYKDNAGNLIATYEGYYEKINNKKIKCGPGTYTEFPSGNKYIGNFRNDKLHGQVSYITGDGHVEYTMGFRDGKKHGLQKRIDNTSPESNICWVNGTNTHVGDLTTLQNQEDKACDGKEDAITRETIPNGKGYSLTQSSDSSVCIDQKTLTRLRENPFTRQPLFQRDENVKKILSECYTEPPSTPPPLYSEDGISNRENIPPRHHTLHASRPIQSGVSNIVTIRPPGVGPHNTRGLR